MVLNEELLQNEEDENGAESWMIEDDQSAEWALQKIKEAQAEFDKWNKFYSSMIEKAEQRKKRTIDFMTEKLRQYFENVPHKESKTQEKYSLPSGDLVMKKPKSVWEHENDSALLDWVKENGFSDCIKVVERVSWSDVKKRLKEDPNGIICDAETGLVCEAVKAKMTDPEFVVNI